MNSAPSFNRRRAEMRRKTVRVVNPLGFHARAAARFVAEASKFAAQITVVFKDKEMDGKSILGLLLLAAPCGASLQLRAEGKDEAEAIRALAALVAAGFGEVPKP